MSRRTEYYEDLTGGKARELDPEERARLVRQNWENTARKLGKQKDATIRDLHMRELNTQFALGYIEPDQRICDIGCGNGNATARYAEKGRFALGADYIPDFIEAAKELHAGLIASGKAEFRVGDIRDLSPIRTDHEPFDVVVAERTLINLATWDEQKGALDELSSLLKSGGLLILTEVTRQGHESVDQLRQQFGLGILQKHWNNIYIDEDELASYMQGKFDFVERENFGVYILLSRIVNAAQAHPEEPSFDAPINEIGFKLSQQIRFPEGPGHHISLVYRKK